MMKGAFCYLVKYFFYQIVTIEDVLKLCFLQSILACKFLRKFSIGKMGDDFFAFQNFQMLILKKAGVAAPDLIISANQKYVFLNILILN